MASSRRIGAESSKTRAALLDAAEELMLDEGYAAVTSRRVASRAGLKPQLVHYYFRTMEDLFLAVFRRRAEVGLQRQAEALASPQPLRALWAFSNDPSGTALTMEFTALAGHRKAIRAEIADYAERFRIQQLAALTEVLHDRGIDPEELPPVVVLVLMTSLSRVLVMEDGLGMSVGHHETRDLIERWLVRLEGPPPTTGGGSAP
jgi:AcrR family transcriptional regulator